MNKVKPARRFQPGKINTFWLVWKVWFPLGILLTDMIFAYNSVARDSSLEGLVLMRLVSIWEYWQVSRTPAAIMGLLTGTIIKRSQWKGALVGLETFLESIIGSLIGATTASLIISAETNENTVSDLIFVWFCWLMGLIIGASWQAIGWVLYQGLRKSQV